MNEEILQRLTELVERTKQVRIWDYTAMDNLRERIHMILRNVISEDKLEPYINHLYNIKFEPKRRDDPVLDSEYENFFEEGRRKLIAYIDLIYEEFTLFNENLVVAPSQNCITSSSFNPIENQSEKKVFIVHGRNEEMKLAVARTLQILECSPIILHEQPNKGRTIIEKFSNYSDVSFAVVILSPDDKGFLNDDSPVNAHHRARQNVIFELGYFIGKLGRERVFPLYLNPPKGNLEIPSDYSGVVYTEYDSNGNWRYTLVKELRTCGIAVDANKLC